MTNRFATLALISLIVGSGAALAHTGAMGVVKQRMDMMDDIAAQMKTVGQMINGQSDFDREVAANAARRVAGHAQMFEAMFPEGSLDAPSEAVPAIWTDWDTFLKISAAMESHAVILADAAAGAGAASDIKAPFGQLASTCKTCHEGFRQQK